MGASQRFMVELSQVTSEYMRAWPWVEGEIGSNVVAPEVSADPMGSLLLGWPFKQAVRN